MPGSGVVEARFTGQYFQLSSTLLLRWVFACRGPGLRPLAAYSARSTTRYTVPDGEVQAWVSQSPV